MILGQPQEHPPGRRLCINAVMTVPTQFYIYATTLLIECFSNILKYIIRDRYIELYEKMIGEKFKPEALS
ncbi:MAG: hypothetical protein ACRDE8_10620, partial [Ginsengibacter sp.]